MGGRGSSSSRKSTPIYTEGKDGIRVYDDLTEEGAKAFVSLSGSDVHWNKGAFVTKDGERGVQVRRGEMMNHITRKGINHFILRVPKDQEKRALSLLSDYGYNVAASVKSNANATQKFHELKYFVTRKEMQYLGLDLKVKKYYKRGWKG